MLEDRTLLTSLIFETEDLSGTPGVGIALDNSDFIGSGTLANPEFDTIIIETVHLSAASLDLDLSDIGVKKIVFESIVIDNYLESGIDINLDSLSALETLVIESVEIHGAGGAAINITLNDTTIDHFVIFDSSVDGINIFADSSNIRDGRIIQNSIRGGIGVEGIKIVLQGGSSADGFTIANNSEISSFTEDGILLDFDKSPVDGFRVEDNVFSTGDTVGLDFLVDGDTFTQPFTITNTSAAGQLLENFLLDIGPAGLEFDIDNVTGKPFTPFGGTEVPTDLQFPVDVVQRGTTLEMDFNDFDPGESFKWNIDLDLAGEQTSVFGNDLIDAIVTLDFTGGQQIGGVLVEVPGFPDAARFVASQGGAGGVGLNIKVVNSALSGMIVENNVIEGNSGSGIVFEAFNSNLEAVVNDNQINANQSNGVEFRMQDSDFTGELNGNAISGNQNNGIAFSPNVGISGTVEDVNTVGPLTVTSQNHGLQTGDTIVIAGVAGATPIGGSVVGPDNAANGAFTVTVLNSAEFLLDGIVANAVYTGGGKWFKTPAAGNISSATNTGPVVIRSASHGLVTGDRVSVTGVEGNLGANGTYLVTVVDADTFSLDGSASTGDYTRGGVWFQGNVIDIRRGISGNSIAVNREAGVRFDLPAGTVFLGDFDRNTFNNNFNKGLSLTADAGLFDLNIGNDDPASRNIFTRNVGAGIDMEILDTGAGSYRIKNNLFIAQQNDPSSALFNGDGFHTRLEGSSPTVEASSTLVVSQVRNNTFGVDNLGNEGSGFVFSMKEGSVIDILDITNNRFINNGEDGFKFFRRDDADFNQVRVVDNILEGNRNDGLEMFAQNTTRDILDWEIANNQITNNGTYGIRLRLEADARVQVTLTENIIDFNGILGGGLGPGGAGAGIGLSGFQQNEVLMNLTNNLIRNNFGDGLSADSPEVFDTMRYEGIWVDNAFDGNTLSGVRMDGVAFGVIVMTSNSFSENNDDGFRFQDGDDFDIFAFRNVFEGNANDGMNLGQGVSGLLGDGTVPNINFFRENGRDGFKISQSSGIYLDDILDSNGNGRIRHITADNNHFLNNGDDGIDVDGVQTTRFTLNDSVVFGNQGDGVEWRATGGANALTVRETRITFNGGLGTGVGGRGIDFQQTHDDGPVGAPTFSFTDFTVFDSVISSNAFEGIYVLNTASLNQPQARPDDDLVEDGNLTAAPQINVRLRRNIIESNGNSTILATIPTEDFISPDPKIDDPNGNEKLRNGIGTTQGTLGGVVIRVGTIVSDGATGLAVPINQFFNVVDENMPLDQTFIPRVQLGGPGVDAEILDNFFDGNFGSEVYFDSFNSTATPPRTLGVWAGIITQIARDPVSRFDLVFRGNTTNPDNSLDVTNGFAWYNNNESEFKSRSVFNYADNPANPTLNNPIGPHRDPGTRRRNATRTIANPRVWIFPTFFGFEGWGRSLWRVEPDFNIDPNFITDDTFGFSDFNTSVPFTVNPEPGELPYVWDTGEGSQGNSLLDGLSLEPGDVYGLEIEEDRLEDYDSFARPWEFGTIFETVREAGLTIEVANDDDYYRFTANSSGTITIDLFFDEALGDLDIELYEVDPLNITEEQLIASSNRSNPRLTDEQIVARIDGGKEYIVRVYGVDSDTSPDYELVIPRPIPDDPLEDNDTLASATELGEFMGPVMIDDLTIHEPLFAPQPGVILETESVLPLDDYGDNIGNAQPLDARAWNLEPDEFIGDLNYPADPPVVGGFNTSTSIPHVTVQGTGDGTFDFYSFTLENDGDRVILDIDNTGDEGPFGRSGLHDFWLSLYDADGNFLAANDDTAGFFPPSEFLSSRFLNPNTPLWETLAPNNLPFGNIGSIGQQWHSMFDTTDPRWDLTLDAGTYFVMVGNSVGLFTGTPVPVKPGAQYELHVSVENHPLVRPVTFPGDEDVFEFTAAADGTATADITFDHIDGDLNLEIIELQDREFNFPKFIVDDDLDLLGSAEVAKWIQLPELTNTTDYVEDDMAGFAVDILDDRLIVGAPSSPNEGNGKVVIYVRDDMGTTFDDTDDVWTIEQTIISPHNAVAADARFGESVALFGDFVVVGSPGDDGALGTQGDIGGVFVYHREGSTWTQVDYLQGFATNGFEEFGLHVDMSEDFIIGSSRENVMLRGVDSGSVMYYARNFEGTPNDESDDSWGLVNLRILEPAPLFDPGNTMLDFHFFGADFELTENLLFVSARGGDGNIETSGVAYVFSRDDNGTETNFDDEWIPIDQIFASDGLEFDDFGRSLTVTEDGSVLVIGAPGDDLGAETNQGSAYIYVRNDQGTASPLDDTWEGERKIFSETGNLNDQFGYDLDIESDTIVVGARLANNDAGTSVGSVYVFRLLDQGTPELDDDVIIEQQKLDFDDPEGADSFGSAVGIFGQTIIVGAPTHNHNDEDNLGGAFVFARAGDILRLTPEENEQRGAAWYKDKVPVAFEWESSFDFRISRKDGGRDGIAFIVQNSRPNEIRNIGGEMAYNGMPNSLVVEIDTFQSAEFFDPDHSHISVHNNTVGVNGTSEKLSLGLFTTATPIDDSEVHNLRVNYIPGTLTVFLDGDPILEIDFDIEQALDLDDGTAFIGFTASTGFGALEQPQTHDILNWFFTGKEGVVLDSSLSETDFESVSADVIAGERYYVRVFGVLGATSHDYDITIVAPSPLTASGETGNYSSTERVINPIGPWVEQEFVTTTTVEDDPIGDTYPISIISHDDVSGIFDAAVDRWSSTGLTGAQIDHLNAANYELVDLSGFQIGSATSSTILIDIDAAGFGWFVDETPLDDTEFELFASPTRVYASNESSPAQGRMDLLTTVMHELGHVLGLVDLNPIFEPDNIMASVVTAGERRLPAMGQADGVDFTTAVVGTNQFLAGPITVDYFDADSIDANPGDDIAEDAGGNTSLRAAIMEANASPGADTILIIPGMVNLDIVLHTEDEALKGDLDITDDLTIQGAGVDLTIIDASALFDRVFHIHSGVNVNISNLTIRGGFEVFGGGIFNEGNLNLENVNIVENTALAKGGGIFNTGTLSISETTISGNFSESRGGGLFNSGIGSVATISATTFHSNEAVSRGGAIFNEGTLTVIDSTISNEHSESSGGGIFNDANASFTNVTITENSTEIRGGGINSAPGANTVIANTLIAGNSATQADPDLSGTFDSQGHNFIGDVGNAFLNLNGPNDQIGGGFLPTIDPLLFPLGDYGGPTFTHFLHPDSSARDGGDNAAVASTGSVFDQRGFDRIVDGDVNGSATVDIGAVEAGDFTFGGIAWEDFNEDGIRGGFEPPLAGVEMELIYAGFDGLKSGVDNIVMGTTTTDAFGNYIFHGLVAGAYFVRATEPTFHSFSPLNVGSDAFDSDFDPLTGETAIVSLDGSFSDRAQDVGLIPDPASIGDFVFLDSNANGLQDSGELGVQGIVVSLFFAGLDEIAGTPDDVFLDATLTDANGAYLFEDLLPVHYYVHVTLPSSLFVTAKDRGFDDTIDNDADPNTNRTDAFKIIAGQNDDTRDIGVSEEVQIGDRVWEDQNGNGLQDIGEPGISGVTVNLFDAGTDGEIGGGDDTLLRTTTTDANGNYLYELLPAGTYYIEFVAPVEFEYTEQDVGGNDELDSDADIVTGFTEVFSLSGSVTDNSRDAGLIRPIKLGDFVWNDLNADGIQQPGEPGVSDVTIDLFSTGADGAFGGGDDVLVRSALTDSNGGYLFEDLDEGEYYIVSSAPAGFSFTFKEQGGDISLDSDINTDTGRTDEFTLSKGEFNDGVDVGFVESARIGNRAWIDFNENGIQQIGEPGLANVAVRLLSPGVDGVIGGGDDVLVQSTTTDANGGYLFDDLAPGNYYVEMTTPNGLAPTFLNQGGDDDTDSDFDLFGRTALVTVIPGQTETSVDGGYVPEAILGSGAWFDANGNGFQDSIEPTISDVQADLFSTGNDGVFGGGDDFFVETTRTDFDGEYRFNRLTAGRYYVVFTAPNELSFTLMDQGSDESRDSDADRATGITEVFTLMTGQHKLDLNAGLILPTAGVGNRVWNDLNTNGFQDPGEPGVPGLEITLVNAGLDGLVGGGDDVLMGTDISDVNGFFLFANLPPGTFYLVATIQIGQAITFQNATADPTVDSNFDQFSGISDLFALDAGTIDLHQDLGIVDSSTVGNFVWEDVNGDGFQQFGEPGISGVSVSLFSAGDDDFAVGTTVTDANGAFEFQELPPGNYYLEFSSTSPFEFTSLNSGGDGNLDSDVDPATGRTAVFFLDQGLNDDSHDAGQFVRGTVETTVWRDANGDGRFDNGEQGISNLQVQIYDPGANGIVGGGDDILMDSKNTNGSGVVTFFDLRPGEYFLLYDLPPDDRFSPFQSGSDPSRDSDADFTTGVTPLFLLTSGEINVDIDAGIIPGSSIGDFVFEDLSRDGVQQAGEPGIEGVQVQLFDVGIDGEIGGGDDVLLATETTNLDGLYEFSGLEPGNYYLQFEAPAGMVFTLKDVTDDRNDFVDSDAAGSGLTDDFSIGIGENNNRMDAGLIQDFSQPEPPVLTAPAGTISNTVPTFVWTDVADAETYDLVVTSLTTGLPVIDETAIEDTSFTPIFPLQLGSYEAKVRSVNVVGESDFSTPVTFTIQVTVPSAPTVTAPSPNTTDSTPSFSWTEPTGAETYQLLVYNVVQGREVINEMLDINSFTPNSPLLGGEHQAYVRARNLAGFSAFSNRHVFTIFSGPTSFPGKPTITGPPIFTGDTTPTVTWTGGTGAETFEVLIYNVRTGQEVVSAKGITIRSFTVESPLRADEHQVFVRSVNALGPSAYAGPHVFTVEPTLQQLPDQPVVTGPSGEGIGAFPTFTWNDADRAVTYELLVYNVALGREVVNVRGITETSFSSTSSFVPGTYQVFVRAVNEAGPSLYSAPFLFEIASVEDESFTLPEDFTGEDLDLLRQQDSELVLPVEEKGLILAREVYAQNRLVEAPVVAVLEPIVRSERNVQQDNETDSVLERWNETEWWNESLETAEIAELSDNSDEAALGTNEKLLSAGALLSLVTGKAFRNRRKKHQK